MNWIQILSQSKPMALPFERPDLGPDFQHEKSTTGLNKIDERMTEETANEQQAQWPGIGYLGSGAYGVAVDLPSGFVGKYSYEKKEAEIAKAIMENPIPGIVHIYSVEEVQQEIDEGARLQRSMWMIISEKVKILDKRDAVFATYLRSAANSDNNSELLRQNFEYHKDRSRQPDASEQLFNSYIEMAKSLMANGIPLNDAHGYNVGYNREGKLVLFDLGI